MYGRTLNIDNGDLHGQSVRIGAKSVLGQSSSLNRMDGKFQRTQLNIDRKMKEDFDRL